MEKRIFRTLNDKKIVDLVSYIKDYIKQHPNVEILIATDSQNRKRSTVFGLTLCLYKPKKGGHVLYSRFETNRIKDNYVRLIQEVWTSINLAEYIREELNIKVKWIDMDLNGFDIYDSNRVLRQCLGMCNAYGYESRYKHKPNEPALLTYASDKVCR